jgi:hypothetical protein
MLTLSADLKAKLAPLLRMQASNNDGERANASAAIGRLLTKHGLDWHDLTAVLLSEPQSQSQPQPQQQPYSTSWKRSDGPIDLSRADLVALLDTIEQRTSFLSLKAVGFIASLRSRAYRPKIHLSEKQWAWLQDLLAATGV